MFPRKTLSKKFLHIFWPYWNNVNFITNAKCHSMSMVWFMVGMGYGHLWFGFMVSSGEIQRILYNKPKMTKWVW